MDKLDCLSTPVFGAVKLRGRRTWFIKGLLGRIPSSACSLRLLCWYHEYVCPAEIIDLSDEKSITDENDKY